MIESHGMRKNLEWKAVAAVGRILCFHAQVCQSLPQVDNTHDRRIEELGVASHSCFHYMGEVGNLHFQAVCPTTKIPCVRFLRTKVPHMGKPEFLQSGR
jgi:hypothetical protein